MKILKTTNLAFMKKIRLFFVVIFSFCFLAGFGQTDTQIINKAKQLVVNKKYDSAFKMLNKYDSLYTKPDMVLLQEHIALNYFVESIMHQLFALKDLKKNENIEDYRGKNGKYDMYKFPIDSCLISLILKYPNDCKLYNGLGDYYWQVYLHYGDQWLIKSKKLLNLAMLNYKKAIEKHCANYKSYYVSGFVPLNNGQYRIAIPYFLKSIEMDSSSDNANSYYNLGYAYLFTNNFEKALKYTKLSLRLYTDIGYRSDAARMIGKIYAAMHDDKNALVYYERANKIEPENYDNLNALLGLYVKYENSKESVIRKQFFDLEPSKPEVYNDLRDIYSQYKKMNSLIAFYKRQLPLFKEKARIEGTLNFYIGSAYMDLNKYKSALNYAKACYKSYSDSAYKSSAALMIGELYEQQNDDNTAIFYYEKANELSPHEYNNLKSLLNMYVKDGNSKATAIRKQFFDLDPRNPTIYNDLGSIYHTYKKDDDLIAFYKQQLPVFKGKSKIVGTLDFYLGSMYFGLDNKQAKKFFMDAKETFSKVFTQRNQVFVQINDALKKLDGQ